jgi:hypothetical protein
MRLGKPLFVLLVAAALSGAGCYTLLRHPEVPDLASEQDDGSGRKACADCHTDAQFYHDATYGDASWYDYYPAPWAAYYEYPWWYNDYWNVAPQPDGAPVPAEVGGRHVWSRDSGGAGFLPVQGDQNQSGNSKPTSPDKPKDTKDTKDKEKKDQEKRHVWSR